MNLRVYVNKKHNKKLTLLNIFIKLLFLQVNLVKKISCVKFMTLTNIRTNQIRAARSLLGWTQEELATRCGISKFSVANMEGSKRGSQEETINKVVTALELAGIEFIDNGVRLKSDSITIIDGDNWYLTLLDDVQRTLLHHENKELLIEFADESVSPPEVVEKLKVMREIGIKMRLLVSEESKFLAGPREEYRYVPKNLFNHNVSIIYADKIALCTDTRMRAVVIKDPLLLQTRKNMFELAWSILKIPDKKILKDKQSYE